MNIRKYLIPILIICTLSVLVITIIVLRLSNANKGELYDMNTIYNSEKNDSGVEIINPNNTEAYSTYYVDSRDGDDKNDGISEETAWKSIDKVNGMIFHPGDKIYFKAGSVWDDAIFQPKGSGSSDNPIVVDAYGDFSDENNKPLINANQQQTGSISAGIFIENVDYWEINNLQITNMGGAPGGLALCYGVFINAESYGVMEHIYIRNLYVHDIQGKLEKSNDEGTGIFFRNDGTVKTKISDLRIEYNHLERVARNGIGSIYGFSNRKESNGNIEFPYRNTNVFIRGNLLEAVAGDGIKPWGCDGALVEYNIVRGAMMNAGGASAGIWPFECDNTVIQYNEVSGVMGTMDGQAFDIDFYTTNTVIQYNYSHDNMGGFILLCSPGWAQSSGNVIRYNISQNDGGPAGWNYSLKGRLIQHGGGNTDTQIYNNTFYIGADQEGYPLISLNEWEGGYPQNVSYKNNLFIVESTNLSAFFEGDQSYFNNLTWENNIFMGVGFKQNNLKNQIPDGQTVMTDADLSEHLYGAGHALFGMDTALAAYTLKENSELAGKGAVVDENDLVTSYHTGSGSEFFPGDYKFPYTYYFFTNYNSNIDFGGTPVNTDSKRSVGAVQAGSTPDKLPAPDIINIEQTPEGIKVDFTPVNGAAGYMLIYGRTLAFGYDSRIMKCGGNSNSFTIANTGSADEYFFAVCANDSAGNGFYSHEKRFTVTDVIVDNDFSEEKLDLVNRGGNWEFVHIPEEVSELSLGEWTNLYNIIQNSSGTFTSLNRIDNFDASSAFAGETNWTDYELTATIRNIKYGQWGCQTLWVRTEEGKNIGFEIVFSESEIQIKKQGEVIKKTEYSFSEGAVITAKISANKNVITVYVEENGVFDEKMSYIDNELIRPSGKIGIGSWNAMAEFTNISVRAYFK